MANDRVEVVADFRIWGNERVDELLEGLTVIPSRRWNAGDCVFPDNVVARYRRAGWYVRSPLPASATVAQHLKQLVRMLKPHTDEVAELVKRSAKAEFAVTVYCYGNARPELRLDRGLLRALVSFRADVDVDLYRVPESPP